MHLGKKYIDIKVTQCQPDESGTHELQNVSTQKDLRIIINDKLNWLEQSKASALKANNALGRLKKAFKNWELRTFKLLYTSLVRPHLEYASSA